MKAHRVGTADTRSNPQLSNHACQATGLIAAQAQCSISKALAILRTRAANSGESVEALARKVLAGVVKFDDRPRSEG
jgi:hypothetical protein